MASPGSETNHDFKEEPATGKEDIEEEERPAKKMRKKEGCTLYSCKEEEAEEAKKKAKQPAKKKKMKKKKKRCALDSCKTKLGLTAYHCRCGRFIASSFLFVSLSTL